MFCSSFGALYNIVRTCMFIGHCDSTIVFAV